jgi:hypothetical protein
MIALYLLLPPPRYVPQTGVDRNVTVLITALILTTAVATSIPVVMSWEKIITKLKKRGNA